MRIFVTTIQALDDAHEEVRVFGAYERKDDAQAAIVDLLEHDLFLVVTDDTVYKFVDNHDKHYLYRIHETIL